MTSTIGKAAKAKTLAHFGGTKGVQANLIAMLQDDTPALLAVSDLQMHPQNAPAELAERAGQVKYPVMNVHCLKIVNDFKEKFRVFSGRVWMGVEVRHTHDRLEGLETQLMVYVDALTNSLDAIRGDWGDGMYYAGGYEVEIGAVKKGGRNVLQSATVKFAIEVGR